MNLSIGIVGLPNVGKSTLFNALLKKQQAFVANYPFATIEPNVGIVPVPDARLDKLAEIIAEEKQSSVLSSQSLDKSQPVNQLTGEQKTDGQISENGKQKTDNRLPPIIPAIVKFVDIAGLVKGASHGEGLGNKFLSHIRETDIICHVQRHFKDTDIPHVSGEPKPEADKSTINTELILADLETLTKQIEPRKQLTKEDRVRWQVIVGLRKELGSGTLAKDVSISEEEKALVKDLNLITAKPTFFIANVSEGDLYKDFGKDTIAVCAKTEAELAELSEDEQKEYLKSLGLSKSGLEKVIEKGYEMLGLISFLTAGEKEVRAWTLRRGDTALRASSVIHTDFEKKFIKAEVVSFEDFIENNGWKGSRTKGKARLEGRDYIIQDGDVVEFKIGK